MINVVEITIDEFKKSIYNKYIKLFPKDEQRDWKSIEKTYQKGIEKFYKIVLNNDVIGFFMLEKLENHPFYLDYFAIFEEFQNLGYGTKSIKILMEKIVGNEGLMGEIEKETEENPITLRRLKFYQKLGFKKVDSEYLLYKVLFRPIINCNSKVFHKKEIDKFFFDYYNAECGEEAVKKHCKIVK